MKRSPLRKASKTPRKRLIKKLDELVSRIVRLRDGGQCVQCGSTVQLTAGHVFSRRAYSTRWDLSNVFAQCWSDNYRHGFDPYPYWKWYQDKFGVDRFEELRRLYEQITKLKDWQLEEMIAQYETIEQSLKESRGSE